MIRGVRITVLRRELFEDLIRDLVPSDRRPVRRCPAFADGQEFLLEGWPESPDGFCENAWHAMHTGVMLAAFDADLSKITVPGRWIACCPDGLRPVVFSIEPIGSRAPHEEGDTDDC
jgi:uncharacterized repeat protein (TIGR04076 family)